MHGVGADAAVPDLDVEVLVELDHGRLGRGVGGVEGDVEAAGCAGDGDDGAGPTRLHGGEDGLDEGDAAADVDLEHAPPGVDGRLGFEMAVARHARGVDEDFDGAPGASPPRRRRFWQWRRRGRRRPPGRLGPASRISA